MVLYRHTYYHRLFSKSLDQLHPGSLDETSFGSFKSSGKKPQGFQAQCPADVGQGRWAKFYGFMKPIYPYYGLYMENLWIIYG